MICSIIMKAAIIIVLVVAVFIATSSKSMVFYEGSSERLLNDAANEYSSSSTPRMNQPKPSDDVVKKHPTSLGEDERLLIKYIESMQYPSSCTGRTFARWPGGFSGYGSQIGILVRSLVNGLLTGHTTVVGPGYHGKHPYVSKKRCPKRTITGCVYRELSNCTARQGRNANLDAEDCTGWTQTAFDDLGRRAGLKSSHSKIWYFTRILRWLMTPNEDLQKHIDIFREKFFPRISGEKSLCVHVRHGDRKESKQYPDEQYAAIVNQAIYTHGFNRIYLMSDDPESYKNLRALIRPPISTIPQEYFAVVNYTGNRQHAANIVWERQKYDPEKGVSWDEALLFSAIFELWIENCEGLIGNFKSSFPSIMFFLRLADSPFEFHYDMDKGGTPSLCLNHMAPLPMGHITDIHGVKILGNSSTGWKSKPLWLGEW